MTAMMFLVVTIAIWFYAAVRPPLWFAVRLTELISIMFGVDMRLMLIHALWTLVGGAIAMLAGAWVYQEK